MGEAAVRREAYNFYFRDTWKITPKLTLNYGLRYEVNSRIKEAHHLTSGVFFNLDGAPFLVNPQPHYAMDWNGWGPRLAIDWRWDDKTVFHAGGAITTLLPNLWQQNMATGGLPFVAYLYESAAPGAAITFSNTPQKITLPGFYTPGGQLIYASGKSMDVAPNTVLDVLRFERESAALSVDKLIRGVSAFGMDPKFGNGYVASYTAGLERKVGDVTVNAAYVGTAGVKLARIDFPNGYGGADPAYAPYTQFNAAGQVTGGYAVATVMANSSHSTYHSLQVSASKTSLRHGLGLQASYTFSKSLDDTSSVLGGFIPNASGTVLQASPQDPWNLRAEKGPFNVRHAARIFGERGAGVRAEPCAGAARAGAAIHGRVARAGRGHADVGVAVHGLFGHPTDRSGGQRGGQTGPGGRTGAVHQPDGAGGLLRAGRQQRVVVLNSD